jgi:DNA invertase Pin-like site-specific DNA recombinase
VEAERMSRTFEAALYARVSTEDRQSPVDSIAWQRSIAAALIESHGGHIAAEYLDVGVSRSLPWSRRPEAARLLADCARSDCGFDAIVIGEPQRAFASSQYGLTAPLLWHHGVELWVPEVGGRVDPDSEAHDLVMSLFGGLSKAERARIQRRVRNAMQTMARAGGRDLGGRPPYGYRLVPVSPHPNAEKASMGATLNRLEPDPETAAVIRRIFRDRLAGAGYSAIARRLNTDGIPSPAQHDPQRNSHRNGPGWADSAVRAILRNARYTGHEVFGRQRRDYDLIDVAAPAEGHVRRMRWNDPSAWIWSPEPTHEALVSKDDWTRAQSVVATVKQRAPKPASRPYLLRGRVLCASCGRRMHGQTRGGIRRYYRCAAQARYPGISDANPRDVLVREQPIIDALDEWLDELFAPEHATQTAQQISAALANGPDRTEHIGAARRRLSAARREVERCRTALRDTNSPAARREVLSWLDETAAEKEQAELALTAAMRLAPPTLSVEEIVAVVEQCGGLTGILHQATDAERTALYETIGISAVYNPEHNQIRLGADPVASTACRRGDTHLDPPRGPATGDFLVKA